MDSIDRGVKVIVRVRPLSKKEAESSVVDVTSSSSLFLSDQQFTFDGIAGPQSSQQAVFEMVGLPVVEHCLSGFNSSVFAYGQTGSGKTYTMWGNIDDSTAIHLNEAIGVAPKVFENLFARMQQKERHNGDLQVHYKCRCSFLEIYNEQIKDLLEPTHKILQVREDARRGVYVDNLTMENISSLEEVSSLLIKGLANRKVGGTNMNSQSSRSHSIFTCVVECHLKNSVEGTSSVKTSKINLVDLAGSERQKQTGAAGDRLKEAGNINRSLSELGNVINILADNAQLVKPRHVPYRNSRLTFLLQESLGGNSKLAMICAISPANSSKNETLSTLRFAQRAKSIQNKAVINEEASRDTNSLREEIRKLKDELSKIKLVPSSPHCISRRLTEAAAEETGSCDDRDIQVDARSQSILTEETWEQYTSPDYEKVEYNQGAQGVSMIKDQREDVDKMENLQAEVEDFKHQLEEEKKLSQELQDALQGVLGRHAEVVEEYSILQEEHHLVLAEIRKSIATNELKRVPSRFGARLISDDAQLLQLRAEAKESRLEINRLRDEMQKQKEAHDEEISILKKQQTQPCICAIAKQMSFLL